jgi:hypothetical protein
VAALHAEGVVARQLEQRWRMLDRNLSHVRGFSDRSVGATLLNLHPQGLQSRDLLAQARGRVLPTTTLSRASRCFTLALTEAVQCSSSLGYGLSES